MDRFTYAIYRCVAAVLRALPLRVVFRLGSLLGSLGYFLAPSYRRLAIDNLRIAFGSEKSEGELRRLAHRHFANLGANLFSSIKLPTLSKDELLSHVTVEGLEHMEEQIALGGGFVFVISHLGNWEMFAQITPYVYKCKVGTIYQALGNAHIDAEVRRDRARLGLALFERKEGFTAAAKYIREGGAVGVLMDQHAGDAGVWCPFFDRLASTTTLPATLAMRTGGWMIPAAIYTDGIAHWRCVLSAQIKPLDDDASGVTLRLNRVLEEQIRVRPEDWFWVHNRWKLPRPKFLLSTYKRGITLESTSNAQAALQRFRMVIRSSNWLGDAVMTIPAVRAIKRGRPDAHVTILTPAKLADLWRTVSEVDEIISIEPSDTVFSVARKLRGRFEVAILFPNSVRVALEAWLAGIPRRVGYPGHRRSWLLNQIFREKKSKKAKAPRHQVYHYLALAEFIGADVEHAKAIRASVPASAPARAPRIGLVPGAEYGPAKRWLPDRFSEVMRSAHERFNAEWTIFGVAKDREITDAILNEAAVPCTDLVGKTTLTELIGHLRHCDVLLTNDTGTMHLAASLDIPVVAIFGSTEPELTGPLDGTGRPGSERHIILRHHVECSPCFLRECPIDFRCMKRIEASEVLDALARQLRTAGFSGRGSIVESNLTET